ncbi:uncharacterized protein LOC136042509 [Artemia franciscana]|uniref:uncharacterized protein LOC136042509 n=1 Tax=Artemia franciscana TaxID=6661 RepID=UPI0032DA4E2D
MAKNVKQVYENIGKFGALSSPRRLALATKTRRSKVFGEARVLLDLIVFQYKNSPHRSLGNLEPNQVSLQNTPYISDFMYGKSESKQKKLRNQLQVGKSVRILRGKGIFEKGEFNFSKEIFRIASVQSTDPVTFKLVDLSDEPVLGCFYQSELQKVQEPDEYVIDEVLKR